MSQHSDYSPSRLARIVACPGSVSLCKEVPQLPTSAYAAEGTLLHTYMEQSLDAWPDDPQIQFEPEKEIDHMSAITDCMEYVQQHVPLDTPGIKKFVETKVSMKDFDEVYGTLDFGVLMPNAVHIFDWKFGRGVEVSAKRNPQLMSYLDGFLNVLSRGGIIVAPDIPLYVHVVQPRIDNYQWELVTIEELEVHRAEVRRAIALSKGKNPPFNPGPEQCRWCDAAAVCKHRISQAQMDVEAAFAGVVDIENNHADIKDITALLEKKSDIEACLKQIQQFVFLELAKGKKVEGFKLVRGRSNRAWGDNATVDAISELLPDLPLEQVMVTKLISPAQLEKLVPKKDRELLAPFIVKPEGALTIAPANSPKPEAQISNPEEIYAGIVDSNAGE